MYGCRAWVNFNGVSASKTIVSATYSQSGTTVTVTSSNHGHQSGHRVYVNATGGTAVDGAYVITAVTPNTFTYTAGTSLTTSGACELWYCPIRASGNINSVAYAGTGLYAINFAASMPDANYCANATAQYLADGSATIAAVFGQMSRNATAFSTMSVLVHFSAGTTANDVVVGQVSVFR